MAAQSPTPSNVIRVRTYKAIRPWLDGVRTGKINLFFLTGGPGLSKSRMVTEALAGRRHLVVEGHATALKMYIDLHRYRGEPVVIDDEDTFHVDPQKVGLLKCLCNTEPMKRLKWETTSRVLEDYGVPGEFETTSRVVIITNRAKAVNPQVAALFDRGNVVSFEPSAREVHAQVATWFDDPEVLAFFDRWLPLVTTPSMRHYIKAKELKALGIDWRGILMSQWKASKVWLIALVQADPGLKTEEARAAAFAAQGGGERATYFRYLSRWRRIVGENGT